MLSEIQQFTEFFLQFKKNIGEMKQLKTLMSTFLW